jgi:hypothetical protein
VLKKLGITAIIVGLLVVIGLSIRVYSVRQDGGGHLFWNHDEALLVVEVQSSGARLDLFQRVFGPVLVSLGSVRPPDDKRCTQIDVFRITAKDVQHYTTDLAQFSQEPYCFGHFALFNGHIYTGYLAQGKMWRWSGTGFEPATSDELRGFDPAEAAKAGEQVDNVDGWSMRANAFGRQSYPIMLGGQPVTIESTGRTAASDDLQVDLVRQGQPPEPIWHLNELPRIVDRSEYERLFPHQ